MIIVIVLSAAVLMLVLVFCLWTKESTERFEFLSSLITKYPNPNISSGWSLSYIWEFTLEFPEENIEISLEYNCIREIWELEIWSWEALSFLFYYDHLDATPHDSIDLLLDKYNLQELADKAVGERKQRKIEKETKLKEVINRVTSKHSSPSSQEKD